MPCYKQDGALVVAFASQKQYIALYVGEERRRRRVSRHASGFQYRQGLQPLHYTRTDGFRRDRAGAAARGGIEIGAVLAMRIVAIALLLFLAACGETHLPPLLDPQLAHRDRPHPRHIDNHAHPVRVTGAGMSNPIAISTRSR